MRNKKSAARTGIRTTQKNQDRRIITNFDKRVKWHNVLCYAFITLSIIMAILACSVIEFGQSPWEFLTAMIFAMISIFNIGAFVVANGGKDDDII